MTRKSPLEILKQNSQGMSQWIKEKQEEDWDAYFITCMFNQINLRRRNLVMRKEIERLYSTVLTRVIRRPHSMRLEDLPILVACPDFPVPKSIKPHLEDVTINDGQHAHGVMMLPTYSRMQEGLDEHFEEKQALYVRPGYALRSPHAVFIDETPERVVDYMFKSLLRRRATWDDIIVLPRSTSEL